METNAEIEVQAIKNFSDSKIIKLILEELEKDHVGDRRGKMFVFCSYVSSLLHPDYRISVAILGDSSAGKDNLNSTCIKHMPPGKAADFNRLTGASLEDDIMSYNAIYIGEGNFQREDGANRSVIEQLKALAESGMRVMKKDASTGYKTSKDIQQDRKTIIFSTTESGHDEELSTRFCTMSVLGYESKTRAVTTRIKDIASSVSESIADRNRIEMQSWISAGLAMLDIPDFIIIPFADRIPVDCRTDRAKRDLKRFLNLIRVLAFLGQNNRPKAKIDDKLILFAVPEDYLQALEIGSDIFAQSYSGLEPRLQAVIAVMTHLFKDGKAVTVEGQSGDWLHRHDIQNALGIRHRDTIKTRLKSLSDMGIVQGISQSKRAYYSFSVQSSAKYPLIPFKKEEYTKDIESIYMSKLNGISRSLAGKLAGKNYTKPLLCDLSEPEALKIPANIHTDPLSKGEEEISGSKLNAFDNLNKQMVQKELSNVKLEVL